MGQIRDRLLALSRRWTRWGCSRPAWRRSAGATPPASSACRLTR